MLERALEELALTDDKQFPGEPGQDSTEAIPQHAPAAYTAGDLVGTRLGDFEILGEIGRGGMGVVYSAHQISLNRKVAFKLLPPGLGLTGSAVRRFENEARAAARLHHSNIVPVYAIGQESGHYFYAMELVDGQGWDAVLSDLRRTRTNPLFSAALDRLADRKGKAAGELGGGDQPTVTGSSSSSNSRQWFDAVATLLADVADGLQYAHENGVIHRDIKPANLLLASDGRLCVTDFGLARVADEPQLTMSGSLLGTPAYMAPEQIAAGRIDVDRRADIYSLGAVLYETLTLQRPFPGEARDEILTGILTRDPAAPRKLNPRVPRDLETICQKALEKDPARRYQTADELAADLRAFLRRGLITARRPSPWRRATKFVRRHPVAVTVVLAAMILIGSVGTITKLSVDRAREDALLRSLAEARYLIAEGESGQSLSIIEEALALDPHHAEAILLKAQVLLDVNREFEAVALAREVLARDPESWTAHMVLVMASGTGPVVDVDRNLHLREVERLAPQTAEYFYLRGVMETEYRDSLPWLERALELDPGLVKAVQYRAQCLAGVKDFPGAMRDAERVVAMRPRSALGHTLRGRILKEMHDPEGALAAYDRALELDPDFAMTHVLRASVLGDQGRLHEALAATDQAVAAQPEIPLYLLARGLAHLRLGHFDEAIADGERALEMQPDFAWAFYPLAYGHVGKGDVAEVGALLGRIQGMIESWPDSLDRAQGYLELAKGMDQAGMGGMAVGLATRAIALDPENDQNLMVRAGLHRSQGDHEAMVADCERAAAMPVDGAGGHVDRAWRLNYPCQFRDLALADCDSAIALAPHWADAYFCRGIIQADRGEAELAHADFTRASELAPRWSAPYVQRAYLFRNTGEREKALEFFDEYFARDEDANVRWQRARILLLLGRDKEAFADIARIKELVPDRNDGFRYEAYAHSDLGRLAEAEAAIDSALSIQPSFNCYLHRAQYRTLRPDGCAGAVADQEAALALAPSLSPWSMRDLTNLHVNLLYRHCPEACDLAQALAWIEEALALEPDNWSLKYTKGKVFYRMGRHEEAQTLLDAGAEGIRDDPNSYLCFFQAMNLHALGRPEEARAWYGKGVSWMERNFPRQVQRASVRDEAAAILGIGED